MDERDCRILMALVRSPFESYESLGREIGTSGTAVRARLDRLARAGVFLGFACGPSAIALRRHARLAVYAPGVDDVDARDLLLAPEVAWAASAYPSATVAMLYREDPEAPLPAELARVTGREAPDALVTPNDPRELAERPPLSPLDWRVLRAVMDAPRGTARALADATGLTPRTVRERRDRMLREGDLMAFPATDATREEGAILYNAYVNVAAPEDLRALRLANAQRMVTHHDPPGTFLVGYARTYAEAHVAEEKLRALPGATHVTFSVPQGTFVARERLASWVDAEIRRWDKARRRPAHSALPSS